MDCTSLVSSKKVPQLLQVSYGDGQIDTKLLCLWKALGVPQYYTIEHIQISREAHPEKIQGHILCAGPAELTAYRLNCS